MLFRCVAYPCYAERSASTSTHLGASETGANLLKVSNDGEAGAVLRGQPGGDPGTRKQTDFRKSLIPAY
jgi:hypothetical protein